MDKNNAPVIHKVTRNSTVIYINCTKITRIVYILVRSADDSHKKDCRMPSCEYYLDKMERVQRHIVRMHKLTFIEYRKVFCERNAPKHFFRMVLEKSRFLGEGCTYQQVDDMFSNLFHPKLTNHMCRSSAIEMLITFLMNSKK